MLNNTLYVFYPILQLAMKQGKYLCLFLGLFFLWFQFCGAKSLITKIEAPWAVYNWIQMEWLQFDDGKWHIIKMLDRNLGATEAWMKCDADWETASCWLYFQWWNNYWFSWNKLSSIPRIEIWKTTVDFTKYWPWKYNNNLLITKNRNTPSSTERYKPSSLNHETNWNLWWWILDDKENLYWINSESPITWRRWPCPEWYHVPSIWEWYYLMKYYREAKWWKDCEYVLDWAFRVECSTESYENYNMADDFLIPAAWFINDSYDQIHIFNLKDSNAPGLYDWHFSLLSSSPVNTEISKGYGDIAAGWGSFNQAAPVRCFYDTNNLYENITDTEKGKSSTTSDNSTTKSINEDPILWEDLVIYRPDWSEDVIPWDNNNNIQNQTTQSNQTQDIKELVLIEDKSILSDKEILENINSGKLNVTDSEYKNNWIEKVKAYEWAYRHWITTMDSFWKANTDWKLTRIAMAKMLSQYAINVLWKKPDTSKYISFTDVSEQLNSDYDNWVIHAYQLWIMWIWISKFRPFDNVTVAEFDTALSRLLFWDTYERIFDWLPGDGLDNTYYMKHIYWLVNFDIENMKDVDQWRKTPVSNTLQTRWDVLVMLMRSSSESVVNKIKSSMKRNNLKVTIKSID